VENADKAPHAGWLREIYYHLGKLAAAEGEHPRRKTIFGGAATKTLTGRLRSSPFFGGSRIRAHICPTAHQRDRAGPRIPLSGFEFTEYYFVVSDDRQELIGIDAGTRPDSAKTAYEALRAYAPNLPELTTVFITHSHWDHVGGHKYFRA
jgi:Alkyl sulfatase and related hydrolases